ncbi:hypothetical protein A7A08_00190 [Methyloligella halotolerans]|uniref:Zinc-finger protein n=1 Tax=Methyloligella halotolerans TaxID=1177755 RepID=A0A1E2S1Z6_9HYPH|nr:DUF983 domain-containing protein [Methyloligella halotolerans]ODA68368.1 hypothetical protein A7A08_00190 [Methyloligella halotolerans]
MSHATQADVTQTKPAQIDGRSTGERRWGEALWRGTLCRCPACGEGKVFRKYLKVSDHCGQCGEALHHHRADDAPPYVTISIVGHVVVGSMMTVEMAYRPELWVHWVLWLPLTVILSLLLLPPIKGGLIGLQWALLMHGFDPDHVEDLDESDPGRPGEPVSYPPAQS